MITSISGTGTANDHEAILGHCFENPLRGDVGITPRDTENVICGQGQTALFARFYKQGDRVVAPCNLIYKIIFIPRGRTTGDSCEDLGNAAISFIIYIDS